MIHTFIFQLMKMIASYVGHKTHHELVGWHNNEKLMLLGTPDQALMPALLLCIVLVIPFAALTYRWIEKPAMDAARHRQQPGNLAGRGIGDRRPARNRPQ